MQQGWIKLHRKIQDCFLWDDKPYDKARAWIDLILLANHSDKRIMFNGNPFCVMRGQYLTSIRKLSERWGWSYDKTCRYLDALVTDGMLQKESDNNRTLLTVVNYEVYQSDQSPISEQTERSQVNTPNGNKGTNRTVTSDKQEYKELKNDKNEKNVKKEIFGEYRNVKLTHEEYERLGTDYGEDMRKDLIAFLDAYIEEKGYQSKSHNLAIRRWVVDAVKRQKPKQNPESDFFAALDACV